MTLKSSSDHESQLSKTDAIARPIGIASVLGGILLWLEKVEKRKPEIADAVSVAADGGLDAVELDPTSDVSKVLARLDVRVSGAWVELPLHVPWADFPFDSVVLPLARRLAAHRGTELIVNRDLGVENSSDVKKREGGNLSRIADRLEPLGVRVSFHNRAANRRDADADLTMLDTYTDSIVGICIDVGWAQIAGCDALEWIERFKRRVYGIHLRNVSGLTPTVNLSAGDVDMAKVIRAVIAEGDCRWLTLELVPGQPESVPSMAALLRQAATYVRAHCDVQ